MSYEVVIWRTQKANLIFYFSFHFAQDEKSLFFSFSTCAIPGAFFCRPDEFICNNTLCKLHAWVCDGEDDCGDNSDESPDMCGELRAPIIKFITLKRKKR